MAGLRPPEEDFGLLRVPARFCLALLGLLGIVLIALALLERIGVASDRIPQAAIVASCVIFVVMAFLSPGRRPADYYVAGRSIAPVIGGLAAASSLAGLLVIGIAGNIATSAAGIVAGAGGLLLGLLVSALLIAPGLRRFGGYGAGHFLAARFGMKARLAGALVAFCASFLLLVAQLKIAGPLVAGYFGVTPAQGLYAAAALLVLTLLPGGMRSLTWTQLSQYFVVMLACLLPAGFLSAQGDATGMGPPAASSFAPGFASILQSLGQTVHTATAMEAALPMLLAAAGLASLPFMLACPLAAPSPREARHSLLWALPFTLVLVTTCLVLGQVLSAAGIAGSGIVAGDLFAQAMLLANLPSVLAGLLMAGVLAALLATGQAALFSAASVLSHDVYDEILDRKGPAGRRIVVARLLLLIVAAAAVWLVPSWPGEAPALAGWALTLAAAGNFAPLLLGLWWPRCNAAGALAGIITGFGLTSILGAIDLGLPRALGIGPAGIIDPVAAATLGVSAGFVVTVLASFMTEAPQPRAREIAAPHGERRGEPATRERPA